MRFPARAGLCAWICTRSGNSIWPEHAAKVKAHAQPWRSIIAAVVATAAGVAAYLAGADFKDWSRPRPLHLQDSGGGVHRGVLRLRHGGRGRAGRKSQAGTDPAVGSAHAAVVRYAILLVGGATILVLGIGLMKVPIGQLLVGGAVTTILLGIAGQQSLSNIFARLVPVAVAAVDRGGLYPAQIRGPGRRDRRPGGRDRHYLRAPGH